MLIFVTQNAVRSHDMIVTVKFPLCLDTWEVVVEL
jgi:hypothetical protein